MDEGQLVQLLESVLAPDTERVKSATAKLRKEYFISPAALVALIHLLTAHESHQIRQLAAVEARTLVPKFWESIAAEQKAQIRNPLLQSTLNEDNVLVRHSAARVIAAIARIDFQDGDWADLPSFLQQAATSRVAVQREIGIFIIYTLLDVAGDELTTQIIPLLNLFAKTIQDPESIVVRVNTMLALSKTAVVIDADEHADAVVAFQAIFPNMVAVLKSVVEQGDEDRTTQAFEVFQTLLGSDSQLMAPHFKDLLQFMTELASSKSLSNEARTQALAFLMQSVQFRKLKVQVLRLGEQLTLKAMDIATELEELQDGSDDATPGRSALALLDTMAENLPPGQVVAPLLGALPQYINSPDPARRRGGMLALAFCVEGAPDFVGTQLRLIFPMLTKLLDDSDTRVRQAALYALARLADDLAGDVGKEHQMLLPSIVKIFDAAVAQASGSKPDVERHLEIIKTACGAIDSVFGGIEEEDAAKYVEELLPRLTSLIEHLDFTVKGAAISALGAVADSASTAFRPYFEPVIAALSPYVRIKASDEELILRAVTTEALGSIALAVGRDMFRPFVQQLMEASEEALHLDQPRLRETSFILWSNLARVYEEELDPFLDGIVRSLWESLQQEETEFEVELGEEAQELLGKEITIAGRKIKVSAAEGDGDGAEDGDSVAKMERTGSEGKGGKLIDLDDVDSDDEAWEELVGVTGVAMEKEVALEVIAEVLSHTRSKYLPYLEKTVELALGMVSHSFEGARKGAISALWRAYATLWEISEAAGMPKWEPGLPLKVQPTPELKKLGETALTATLDAWETEEDRDVVSEINSNVAAVLKKCGPAILLNEDVVRKITTIVLSVLNKEHICQKVLNDDDDFEDLDELSEMDWLLIDNGLDVVAGLAAALGPTFAELWKIFQKPILKFAAGTDAVERCGSMGAIGACTHGMGAAVTPFTSILLETLAHRLTDENPATRSNAAFATGLLAEKSEDAQTLQRSYESILLKIEPLFSQHHDTLSDNAAACFARMVLRFPDKVPLDDILPTFVDEALPLKVDYDENESVWDMIVKLYQAKNSTIQSLTPQIIRALASVLAPPEDQLSEARRTEVVQLVKYLHQQQPGLLQEYPGLTQTANA